MFFSDWSIHLVFITNHLEDYDATHILYLLYHSNTNQYSFVGERTLIRLQFLKGVYINTRYFLVWVAVWTNDNICNLSMYNNSRHHNKCNYNLSASCWRLRVFQVRCWRNIFPILTWCLYSTKSFNSTHTVTRFRQCHPTVAVAAAAGVFDEPW